MEPLPEFSPSKPGQYCRPKKSLYGFRQVVRNYFAKLTTILLCFSFKKSPTKHSLFFYNHSDIFLALLVYVDDIMLTGNNLEKAEEIKR